jgi:hypothetical protein
MKSIIVEWLILIVSILVVFSPFIYLGIRKWKKHLSVTLLHVLIGYLFSFCIYSINLWAMSSISDLTYPKYILLENVLDDVIFHQIFIVIPIWSLLIFYCSKLIIKNRFSIWHFLVSLIFSILLFSGLVALLFYLMAIGLGYIGRTYF